jgi:hypothetical protein
MPMENPDPVVQIVDGDEEYVGRSSVVTRLLRAADA